MVMLFRIATIDLHSSSLDLYGVEHYHEIWTAFL